MSFEDFISNINEEDLKRLNEEFYRRKNRIPTYSYSKIKDSDLRELFSIKEQIDKSIFDSWFNNSIVLEPTTIEFLEKLLEEESIFIKKYNEEDLKVNFITPILRRVNFKMIDREIRDFYEASLCYKTDRFILKGTPDFFVSKGLFYSEEPYFFIQEFKKSRYSLDPEPQLLAELISGVEINNFSSMRGAYIVGEIWNFVILQKIEVDRYEYFVSQNFDSTKINDLRDIYRNLLFVKEEIIDNFLL
jgi:hypothetical protein